MNENSFAMELLKDSKKEKTRWFIAFLIVVALWFSTIGIFVWYLNQYEFTTEYVDVTTNDGNDNQDGNITIDGDIING